MEYAVWVDFNGTLVHHERGAEVWRGGEVVIGRPIMPMVARVRRHLGRGRRFVVKCAMLSGATEAQQKKIVKAIGDWTQEHLGQRLEVTATARPEFIDIWDDKCRQVVRNAGRFVGEEPR